jgi:hypothetical protein
MTHPTHKIPSVAPRLLVVVLAACATAAALATSGNAQQPAGRTIKVIEDVQHSLTFQFVDVPPLSTTGGPDDNSAGDEIINTNPLLNAAHKRIGTSYSVLTFVTGNKLPKPSVLSNHVVYRLKRGAIFIEELNSGSFQDAIVTGGTGAYAGARGTVDQGKRFNVIHLQR